MDWLNWDDRGHWGHWDHWGSNTGTERGAHCRGGAGLVGPGVVGEPLGGHEVLAGGVSRVHVAPLSPGGVDSQTVALDHSSGVPEGQAAALAAVLFPVSLQLPRLSRLARPMKVMFLSCMVRDVLVVSVVCDCRMDSAVLF